MADVSHEIGSLRYVMDSPLSSKVAMFNNQVSNHQESQHLNPFSQAGGLPRPTFNKGEYGKPLAGSLTEARGQRANIHVLKEMLELCQIIDSEGYHVKDEPTMKVIPFGELFNIYTYISDKVVGILLRARKHKLIEFEGEILFQHRDEDVPIFLLKPIKEIRQILDQKQDVIRRSVSPAPQATSVLQDQRQRPSPSPSPKPKASPSPSPKPKPKNSEVSPKVEIVKPIAQKAVPIAVDPPKDQVQSNVQVIIEPAAQEVTSTATAAPVVVEPAPVAPAVVTVPAVVTAPTLVTAPAVVTPPAVVTAPAVVEAPAPVAPASDVPTTPAPIETKESLQSLETELPQSPPKSNEVIAPVQVLPQTIVTPPTPTAESAPVAVAPTLANNESVPAIVEEKTDVNNNEEAPAIVVTPDTTTANVETTPPASSPDTAAN